MKVLLSLLALIIFGVNSYAQRWINSADARQFKGEVVNVVGYIHDVKIASDGSNGGAMLSFDGHSVRALRLVIAPHQLQQFQNVRERFLNNYVHVKGRITMRKGLPYMVLSSPEQITVVHEAPEHNRYEPL